mmetsp:Transcript_3835/g.12130  ORF Transcript_3835/g.12130 Transcript_3835/m.12130 type:complete len:538 (+) Transcript_3835:1-1614(+)
MQPAPVVQEETPAHILALRKLSRSKFRGQTPATVLGRVCAALKPEGEAYWSARYERARADALGAQSFPLAAQVPTCGAALVEEPVVRRLLFVLEKHAAIEFCPQVPALARILQPRVGEATTYRLLLHVLDESKAQLFYVYTSPLLRASFYLAFQDIVHNRNKKVHSHLNAVAPRVWRKFATLFDSFFQDVLAPEDVLEVVTTFLLKGSKVLYRYALGLLKVHQRVILRHKKGDKLWDAFLSQVRHEPSMPAVRKAAFKLWRFGKSMLYKLQGQWMTQLQEHPDVSLLMEPATPKRGFRGMVTVANDGARGILLGPPNRPAPVWMSTLPIPAALSEQRLRLVYTTERHGWGLQRLFSRCKSAKPVLLVVKAQGSPAPVFGAFAYATLQPHHDTIGDWRTFVFTAAPEVRAYPWVRAPELLDSSPESDAEPTEASGSEAGTVVEERKDQSAAERARLEAETRFLLVREELLAVGASTVSSKFALRLAPSLEHGTSETCDTFRNAPLHGDVTNPRFEIDCVEVYCFHTTALKRHASEPIK